MLKTNQGAARCHAHKIVFTNLTTNQNQVDKVSFEIHALEREYKTPK
jgi:hypothetical protein